MNIEELEKYASLRGLNLGQAEKDYYQNIILFVLYQKTGRELVFKGGTALSKCYGLPRFSEDLDFTAAEDADYLKLVESGLKNFGIEYSIKDEKKSAARKKCRLKLRGPLYKGSEKTLCSITLDFSLRESVLAQPALITIGRHMDVIPAFEAYAMAQEEILAEKVRAIMTRKSARDLYDIVFLLRNGAKPQKGLISAKLALFGLEFSQKAFLSHCRSLKFVWASELRSLVKNVPPFEEYIEEAKKIGV